jgi:hypothetical protein
MLIQQMILSHGGRMIGCIVYEIVTGNKLFCDDLPIVNYSAKGTLHPVWWPEATEETSSRLDSLVRPVASMLETHHRRRPSAREIQKELERICAGICSEPSQTGPPIQVYTVVILH